LIFRLQYIAARGVLIYCRRRWNTKGEKAEGNKRIAKGGKTEYVCQSVKTREW